MASRPGILPGIILTLCSSGFRIDDVTVAPHALR